ncbi:hypothetical protein [Halostagnicola sp. A-GB9-2]|uniref:hypothetical protein n=1 Tax=Halostagnicola sp. A-GB9-2 TaxID=3048066 RepID=UPI0024BF2927|nr:hypothetical protein [Halostagnicola sp. A-GB9-2]MDJ1431866.1 hypothetical protein [Halostagnicola sp. A-GB9-2]
MIQALVVAVIVGILMMVIVGYVANWWGDGVRGSCEECGGDVSYDEIVRLSGPGIENESMYCSRECARRSGKGDSKALNPHAQRS